METKEIKFEIPEGYIIDISNSDLTRGIVKFTKIDTRPKSWEEFCENYPITREEAWFSGNSIINRMKDAYPFNSKRHNIGDRNLCISTKEAEAFLALMQLRQLRKAWVGDWDQLSKCDINTRCSIKYNLDCHQFTIPSSPHCNQVMAFPTQEMAREFIECFGDLLEKAKILL